MEMEISNVYDNLCERSIDKIPIWVYDRECRWERDWHEVKRGSFHGMILNKCLRDGLAIFRQNTIGEKPFDHEKRRVVEDVRIERQEFLEKFHTTTGKWNTVIPCSLPG